MVKNSSNSTEKKQITPLKPPRGNPNFGKTIGFKKDDPITGFKDPKINRKGYMKPKSQREFEKLLDEIFAEAAGADRTRLQAAILDLLTSKDPRGKIELLARRFGKIPDKVNISGAIKTIHVRIGKVEKNTDE